MKPDLSGSEWALEFEATGFAMVDGDEILVPMTIIPNHYRDALEEDGSVRDTDIHVRVTDATLDEVIITPPRGFELARAPEDLVLDDCCISVRFVATRQDSSVRLERRLSLKPSAYDKAAHARMREALRRYRSLRQVLVTFCRSVGPAAARGD